MPIVRKKILLPMSRNYELWVRYSTIAFFFLNVSPCLIQYWISKYILMDKEIKAYQLGFEPISDPRAHAVNRCAVAGLTPSRCTFSLQKLRVPSAAFLTPSWRRSQLHFSKLPPKVSGLYNREKFFKILCSLVFVGICCMIRYW